MRVLTIDQFEQQSTLKNNDFVKFQWQCTIKIMRITIVNKKIVVDEKIIKIIK